MRHGTESSDGEETRHKPDPRQTEFDWTRANRRYTIDKVVLAGLVGRVHAKAVLRAVESHDRDDIGCHLKIETIALHVDCSERTVRRTVESLVELGVLEYQAASHASRPKHSVGRYKIDYCALKQIILDNPETEGLINFGKAAEERLKLERAAKEAAAKEAAETQTKTEAAAVALREKFGDQESPDLVELQPEQASSDRNGSNGGWGRKLSLVDFQNRESIQRHFDTAVKRKFVDASDRARFFTLAKYVGRMAGQPDGVKSPGAYFTAQLKARNWLGDDQDKRAALHAISLVDGRTERLSSTH